MDGEQFQAIRRIFEEALGQEPAGREQFIKASCMGDRDLQREVERLIAAHESADSWIDSSKPESIIRPTSVAFKPGAKVGSYEILELLGVGGMGEVYRARDETLSSRHVAIKVLPDTFSRDPERVARFEREALVLASMNHPNIGAIHHVVESNASRFLILELVEGETLAHRIQRGALPIEETLSYAAQIADALEYAHDKGIVHRDLKPANIKITPDDSIKILDFGLASVRESPHLNPKEHSTLSTAPARILGTAAYMSPEQASGKEADRRSDIWAFGCSLYEMLTGHALFRGESVSEILAEVLKTEPEFADLPQSTPESIRRLLRRCLQKDRKRRLRHIGDARLEIEDAASGFREPVTATGKMSRREWLAWGTVSALGVLGLSTAAWLASRTGEQRVRFAPYTTLPTLDPVSLALSPDGEKILFVATQGTESQLWLLQPKISETPAMLTGTGGAYLPFWAPDSQQLGFFANSGLYKTRIDGGLPKKLARVSLGRGGTWSDNNKILYASNPGTWISQVDAESTAYEKVTQLEKDQVSHRFPQFIDESRFLYYVTGKPEIRGVYVYDLEARKGKRLPLERATDGGDGREFIQTALFAPPSFLLFLIKGQLYVQDFDLRGMEPSGERALVKDMNQAAPVMVNTAIYRAALSVAKDSLIYRTGSASGKRQLSWAGEDGSQIEAIGPLDFSGPLNPSLAPDGRTVVLDRTNSRTGNTDLFLLDTSLRGRNRSTPEREPIPLTNHTMPDYNPVWSRTRNVVIFSNNEDGPWNLYELPSKGGVPTPILRTAESKFASDWSADGEYVLYRSINPEGGYDLRALRYPDKQELDLLPRASLADERDGQFSPDGKWIAYASNNIDERFEIFVVPFSRESKSDGTRALQVSVRGGTQPRWGRRLTGGRTELFYINMTGDLMRARVSVAEDGQPAVDGPPTRLFNTGIPAENPVGAYAQQYAVFVDGAKLRFLLNVPLVENPEPLHLILGIDWKSRS